MSKIKIIFENTNLAVLDKPAGLQVHKKDLNDKENTLVDEIIKIWPAIYNRTWPDQLRPGIVHRLDKDTSGLIVIAKNPETLFFLQKQFKSRQTIKKYLLLCIGKTPQDGEIKTLISKTNTTKQTSSLLSFSWQKSKPKEAITIYKTIKHYQFKKEFLSLVEATILTGRTHQIRNHFNFIGHPLIGDQLYFNNLSKEISDKLNVHRQFLHSSYIKFKISESQEKEFKSDLPIDLKTVIEEIKL